MRTISTRRRPASWRAYLIIVALLTWGVCELHGATPAGIIYEADSVSTPPDSATSPDRSIRLGLIAALNRRITPGYEAAEGVDYTTGGLTGLLRLTLVPEHLLRLGLETGYMKLSSANDSPGGGNTPDRIVLTAIPVLFTLGMGSERFELGGGVGFYELLVSAGTTRKTTISSTGTELGYMANVSWHFPIFSESRLGVDFRIYDFADRPLTVAVLGLSFQTSLITL